MKFSKNLSLLLSATALTVAAVSQALASGARPALTTATR